MRRWVAWVFDSRGELPPFQPYADIGATVLSKSVVLRLLWRIYVEQFTRAGRWLCWPSLLYLGYTLVSLELQTYVPLFYLGMLWSVTLFFFFFNRPRAKLAACVPDRVAAGERVKVEVMVERIGGLLGCDWLVVPHRLPLGLEVRPAEGVPLPPLRRGQRAKASLELTCRRRGVYRLPGFRVESDYPFSLLRGGRVCACERALRVYPRFTPLRRMDLPAGRRYQPGGIALASPIGESVEYVGNREYREGDNIRHVDWRATARLNQPIVREYREEYFYRVAVILDTAVPRGAPPVRRDDFERAVSLAASVSDGIARQEHIVDLFAAGPTLYRLTAGRSLAYLEQILDILACVESCPDDPLARIEPELAESLGQLTTVVTIFLDWDEPRRRFVDRLVRQGVGLKVLVLRDGGCTLDPRQEGAPHAGLRILGKAEFESGRLEL